MLLSPNSFPILIHFFRMVNSPTIITRRSTRLAANVQQSTSGRHETSFAPIQKCKQLTEPSESESSLSSLEDSDEPVISTSKVKGSRKQKGKRNASDDDSSVPTSPRKKRAPKPEPVYTIPDVVRKETTFRGRLGKSFVVA
jgi:UV DNA damage endonuclease